MRLTYEQIKAITCGAVSVEQTRDGICFYRFTEEQRAIYQGKQENLALLSMGTSGIKFCFETDSEHLYLKGNFQRASSRSYFSLDVLVNGVPVGYMDNFSGSELSPGEIIEQVFPVGDFEKEFSLGPGRKQVAVHLPWNKFVTLLALSLDDGSFVTPIKQEKKLLAFGDSITQGVHAMRPSGRYISRLADALGAEEFNKAVGGEIFEPALAATKDGFEPDYIVVAYGTNDWSKSTPEVFRKSVKAVFSSLRNNYPAAKIIAITPIWRRDQQERRAFASFFDIENGIREATAGMENVIVVDGQTLVPHDPKLYADARLHPDDEGFDHYFRNLCKAIER